jgi:transcription antitermination factor NusA-like protein
MKKLLLLILLCGATTITSYAQSAATRVTVEMVTSLPPEDGTPMVYGSQGEMNRKVKEKIQECKQLVVKHQDDPTKASFYREELWRYENAIILE